MRRPTQSSLFILGIYVVAIPDASGRTNKFARLLHLHLLLDVLDAAPDVLAEGLGTGAGGCDEAEADQGSGQKPVHGHESTYLRSSLGWLSPRQRLPSLA